MKKYRFLPFLLLAGLLLTGCGSPSPERDANNEISALQTSEMFTDRDYESSYDEKDSAVIRMNGDSASCDSPAVQISGSTVTISDEGTYILSGTLNNGMIIVDAEKTDKLQIVLNGVEIHSESTAAIYILQADKVFITLPENAVNTLSGGSEFSAIDENDIDAVIFSKEDLTFNGSGSLNLESPAGHGIVSKDDLVVTGGTYCVTAASHGLSGKDSVRIAGGNLTVTSGKDAIHAENAEDSSLGFLCISGGTYQLTADGDGLSASGSLQIEAGSFWIQSGGGSANAVTAASNSNWGSRVPGSGTAMTSEGSTSAKGIKASGDLLLKGGTFNIDAADDAVHSNGSLAVDGGTYEITTGDDGFHADSALVITGGSVQITKSYEGIEGVSVTISGGDFTVYADDDGINAGGGNDQSGFGGPRGQDSFASSSCYIEISGGKLYVNASGDGLDSNGSMTVSGGEIFVSGPTSGGNGALDSDGEAVITGGTVIAVGSSQMAENFGSASTQGSIMVTVGTQSAGSTVQLIDSNGTVLVSRQTDKTYNSVVISCPEILQGGTYTLSAGTYSEQITMESLIYGSGGGMGPGNGGPGMDPGNRGPGMGKGR